MHIDCGLVEKLKVAVCLANGYGTRVNEIGKDGRQYFLIPRQGRIGVR